MSPNRRRKRFCSRFIRDYFYKPQGIPLSSLEVNNLNADELEAMRLCDLEDKEQEVAANQMKISRQTLQRALYSGRKKVVQALVNGEAIAIHFPEYISQAPTPLQGMGFGYGRGRGRRFRGGR